MRTNTTHGERLQKTAVHGLLATFLTASSFLWPGAKSVLAQTHQENAPRQPVQFKSFIKMDDGQYSRLISIYTVPSGKRLVIEQFAVQTGVPKGQSLSIRVRTTLGGVLADHAQPLERFNYNTLWEVHSACNLTRIYADAGTEVVLLLWRDHNGVGATGNGDIASISGYLVDVQ
jgi:hypothetical protein